MSLRPHCLRFVCGLLLVLPAAVYMRADEPADSRGTRATMNVAAFGKLPVRFNGRVTTFDAVSRRVLLMYADCESFVGADGEQYSATRWLLDVIAESDKAESHRVIPIANAELLKMLGLQNDPRVTEYRMAQGKKGETAEPPRFSLSELRPKFSKIDAEVARIIKSGKPDAWNAFQQATVQLRRRLQAYVAMIVLHRFPDLADKARLTYVVKNLRRYEENAFFRLVPARDQIGQWQTCLRAAVIHRASELMKKEPNPAAVSLKAIFAAYRKQDVAGFNKRLAAYQKWTQANGVHRAPFSYSLPKTWRETGVRWRNGSSFFLSVLANGETVAQFELGEGKQSIQAFVRHFTGPTMSDRQIFNDWHIGFGRMPIGAAEFARKGTPIVIAGHQVRYFEFTPSAVVTDPAYKRTIGAVVRHQGHTFLISAGLPDNVTHHRKTFEAFARSVKIGSASELSRWFPDSRPLHKNQFQTTAVALVDDEDRLWSFVLKEQVRGTAPSKARQIFEKLVRSVRTRNGAPHAGIQWTDPVGWERQPLQGASAFYYPKDRTLPAQIAIHVVGGAKGADRLPLVNMVRAQSSLPAWEEKQLLKATRNIEVAGRTVRFIEFEKRPQPALKPAKGSRLTYQLPKGWAVAEKSAFLDASFSVQQGGQSAKVTVLRLPSRENTLVLNINRWRAQLNLPAADAAAIQKSLKTIKVAGRPAHLVDIQGPKSKRIVAAVAVRGAQTWFFTMKGDAAIVEQQKTAFEKFVNSVQFPSGSP